MDFTRAMLAAMRLLYILALIGGGVVFLFPQLGLYEPFKEAFGGGEHALRWAAGFLFVSVLLLYVRGTMLRRDQALIARRLLQLSPDLRHLEAIKILIGALASGREAVVDKAHQELMRLTGQSLGPDPALWQDWLKKQESGAAPILQQASKV